MEFCNCVSNITLDYASTAVTSIRLFVLKLISSDSLVIIICLHNFSLNHTLAL